MNTKYPTAQSVQFLSSWLLFWSPRSALACSSAGIVQLGIRPLCHTKPFEANGLTLSVSAMWVFDSIHMMHYQQFAWFPDLNIYDFIAALFVL